MKEFWGTFIFADSILFVIASLYTVYAAGASVYFLTWVPIVVGVCLMIFLLFAGLVFVLISES